MRVWRKGNIYALLVGLEIGTATMKELQTLPSRITMLSVIPLLSIPKENENKILKRYLHSHVHRDIIHNSQDMETT